MLRAVLKDVPERIVQEKVGPNAMSIHSQCLHLCEAYAAAVVVADGGKFQWGIFHLPDKSWPAVQEELFRLRSIAVARVLDGTDGAAWIGSEYIVTHDHYHVGQMVTVRWHFQPEWDPYSIYNH